MPNVWANISIGLSKERSPTNGHIKTNWRESNGKATAESLAALSEQQWLDVFEGVPQAAVSRDVLSAGVPIVDLLTEHGGFLASKGEARRALKENSIAVNKEKAGEERTIGTDDLLGGKFILLQRGKKNYFLVKVEG